MNNLCEVLRNVASFIGDLQLDALSKPIGSVAVRRCVLGVATYLFVV